MIEKLDQKTLDFTDEHIANIAAMFPHCATETEDENGKLVKAIDFDLLKQELSKSIVDGPKERYRIDWPGKRASLVSANTPITKTLRPAVDESVDFDTTQNLYIEGDNLEALKLLQESYLGEIKMIYIDPPYNTGKDFVYKDNFTRSKEEELEASGQVDEEGGRLVANLESNGRFHSDWLSMMYPRLRLARNLLKDDGVIFISIGEKELTNLEKLCNEVFGESNFINRFVWKKNSSGKTVSEKYPENIDYIYLYSKTNKYNLHNIYKPLAESSKKMYSKNDNDGRGKYATVSLQKTGSPGPQTTYDYVDNTGRIWKCPLKGWRLIKEKVKALENDGRLYFSGTTLREKDYWDERDNEGQIADTLWDDIAENNVGTAEVNKLLGKGIFTNPKPTDLLKRCLNIITEMNDDIVLDFFSGSCSTAHAVMKLNAEDRGNRKFIMVQIPEETDETSEAYKAGYKTIPEIGKERIRRAGKKIKEDNIGKEGIEDLDIGFRVLKIDESNMKDIYFSPDKLDKTKLPGMVNHIKEDRSSEDLLFGVLVDWGVNLTLRIHREEILGKTVFFVGHDDLTACFDEELDEAFIKELASRDSMRVVFKENGFKDDETKINAEQIFTQLSPGTDLRVI